MGEAVVLAARRRPYVFPALLAMACALATWVTANAEDLPIRDPDGVGGPPLVRLSAILAVFMLLDVLPRALARGRGRPGPTGRAMLAVVRERWTGRRLALVLVGLFSFYLTYVAYRNFKGFLPFLTEERHDTALLELDRDLFFGNDPATVMHDLLGTGFANQFLSAVYVVYLAFVPMSLAAALVWFGEVRHGLWYASALCLNWILGAMSYYVMPSLGPAFVAPKLFADLPETASSQLQHGLWSERLTALLGGSETASNAVQSIAAFASLHTSVVLTAALIATLLKAHRVLLWTLWTYLVLVMVATIYLGWHYVVDVPAGILIGVAATALGAWATGHRFPLLPARGRRERAGGGRRERAGDAPADPGAVVNAPNVLSFVRILLAPVVALVVLDHPEGSLLAATLFAAGAVTDALDGHLARTRGLVTAVGKLLDPAADKLLVVGALVSLVAVDRLAPWIVGVIAAREVLVTVLRAHAVRRGVVLAAGPAGKAKMALQVVMVLVLMAVSDPTAAWVQLLVAATLALTVASGLTCVSAYRRERRTAIA
jgi:CDP-diacylglycerol--glycerol-3-phosphate 3-phosphatidyltransferase